MASKIRNVTVIGAGLMGSGIAQPAMLSAYRQFAAAIGVLCALRQLSVIPTTYAEEQQESQSATSDAAASSLQNAAQSVGNALNNAQQQLQQSAKQPLNDVENWLNQAKMNVVSVVGRAGDELKQIAAQTGDFFQGKANELSHSIETISNINKHQSNNASAAIQQAAEQTQQQIEAAAKPS